MTSGWCITQDHFEQPGRKGYGQISAEDVESEAEMIYGRSISVSTDLGKSDIENPIPFKLYGDDMDLAYSGFISDEWLNGEEHFAFAPLRFGEADYGTTIMKYKDKEGDWQHL